MAGVIMTATERIRNTVKIKRRKGFRAGRNTVMLMCMFVFAGGVIACSAPAHLSPDYGDAFRSAVAAQVLNPEAPEDPAPADTLPGEIASQIYKKRYIKSLTEEKKEKEGVSERLRGME
jgi:hypothetical protein